MTDDPATGLLSVPSIFGVESEDGAGLLADWLYMQAWAAGLRDVNPATFGQFRAGREWAITRGLPHELVEDNECN